MAALINDTPTVITFDGGTWTQDPALPMQATRLRSLAVNMNEEPRLLVFDTNASNGTLRFVFKNDAGWFDEAVAPGDSNANGDLGAAINVSPTDVDQIAFVNGAGDVTAGTREGGLGWLLVTVTSGFPTSAQVSLLTNQRNEIFALFFDGIMMQVVDSVSSGGLGVSQRFGSDSQFAITSEVATGLLNDRMLVAARQDWTGGRFETRIVLFSVSSTVFTSDTVRTFVNPGEAAPPAGATRPVAVVSRFDEPLVFYLTETTMAPASTVNDIRFAFRNDADVWEEVTVGVGSQPSIRYLLAKVAPSGEVVIFTVGSEQSVEGRLPALTLIRCN